MPSSLIVTTASDAVSHTGMSLRDALARANTDAAAGTSDTISFAPSLTGATITLAQGQLELSGAGAGTITIDGSSVSSPISVSGNKANRVVQVDSGVQAVFNGLVITAGSSAGSPHPYDGGGIYNAGTLTLTGDIIENNQVPRLFDPNGDHSGEGGGIYNSGTLTMSQDTVENNTARSSDELAASLGGGIFNSGWLMVSASTISDNTAARGIGGGIFVTNAVPGAYPAGTLAILNSTISGNSATDVYGQGGGIAGGGNPLETGPGGATVTLVNCTVSGNSALGYSQAGGGGGGGISMGLNPLTLLNTIVAGNRGNGGPADIDGGVGSGSSNNLIGGDPLLGPLADNGGPTQTMALLSGSPAIAAGGAVATLPSAISAAATTIAFPALAAPAAIPGNFLIRIDGEMMLVTNISGQNITVIRGYNGTTAAPHNANAPIYLATDQRGFSRPNPPDIGAFQSQPSPGTLPVTGTGPPGGGNSAVTPSPIGDVTLLVRVSRGKIKRQGSRFRQTLTLLNLDGMDLTGPLALVLDGLSRKVKVRSTTGGTAVRPPRGSPYVVIVPPGGTLHPGQALTVTLTLTAPAGQGTRFTTRVLAGG